MKRVIASVINLLVFSTFVKLISVQEEWFYTYLDMVPVVFILLFFPVFIQFLFKLRRTYNRKVWRRLAMLGVDLCFNASVMLATGGVFLLRLSLDLETSGLFGNYQSVVAIVVTSITIPIFYSILHLVESKVGLVYDYGLSPPDVGGDE